MVLTHESRYSKYPFWVNIWLLFLSVLILCRSVDASFVSKPKPFLPSGTVKKIGTKFSASVADFEPPKEKLTIQILMSDTGGGHRASANALRDAFDELYPGMIECDIVDIFTEYGPGWPFDSFVPIYQILQANPIFWDIGFQFAASPYGLFINEFFLELFCFEPFKECIESKRADMVVSVHPLTQDIPLKVLNFIDSNGKSRTSGRTTPFLTVVTDLGSAHPTWFNPSVDKCFVPSDALDKAAQNRNLTPDQIIKHGLPIRRGFWADSSNDTSLTNQLGLCNEIPTVLIVGGGDGMGGIVEQARAMGEKLSANAKNSGSSSQMVVICGKNENAKKTLSSVEWGEGVSVQIMGFVSNMDEWMRASDVIVTKAGPGTIAEASICGLPCMLSSFLPGQEEGNIPFVKDFGFGSYKNNPTEIADTVSTWLSSPDRLTIMKKNALKAARPNATIDIARDLAETLFSRTKRKC